MVQRVALWADGPSRGELVLLGAELPQEIRDACTAGQLICPVDDCSAPRFYAAAGPRQVPHFRHHSGAGGHGDESEAHLQAKALIAGWARRCVPEATVEVERRSGERRADVQVRSAAAGWSSAIEFQRSELALDGDQRAWAARQDALAAEHGYVIWLLDPVRVEDHPTNPRAVVASELMRAMARRGLPVRVLDVAERRVTSVLPWRQGTTLLEASNVYRGFAGTRATEHFIQFGAALDDSALVDGQMITPTDRRIAELDLDYRLDPKPRPAAEKTDAAATARPGRARRRHGRSETPTQTHRAAKKNTARESRPGPSVLRRATAPQTETPTAAPSVPQVPLPIAVPPPAASTPAPPVASRPETRLEEPRPAVGAEPQAPPPPPSPAPMVTMRLVFWVALAALVFPAGRLLGWW